MLKSDQDSDSNRRKSLLWVPVWIVCLFCGAAIFVVVNRNLDRQDDFERQWDQHFRGLPFATQVLLPETTPIEQNQSAQPLIEAEQKFLEQAQKDTPEGASALSRLAGFYALQGDYQSAQATYRELKEILTKHLGADHPDVAVVERVIGTMQKLEAARASAAETTSTNAAPTGKAPADAP